MRVSAQGVRGRRAHWQTGVPVPLPSSLESAKGLRRLACSSAYLHPLSWKNRDTEFALAKLHVRNLFSTPPTVTAALESAAAPPVPDLRYLNLAYSSTLSARRLCSSVWAPSCCLPNPQLDNAASECKLQPANEHACGASRLRAPAAQCASVAAGAAQTGYPSSRHHWQ